MLSRPSDRQDHAGDVASVLELPSCGGGNAGNLAGLQLVRLSFQNKREGARKDEVHLLLLAMPVNARALPGCRASEAASTASFAHRGFEDRHSGGRQHDLREPLIATDSCEIGTARNLRANLGDLRVCNATRCIAIVHRLVLPQLASFYYSGPPPVRLRRPPLGTPYYEL
ncbi:MAG: hypothetical protein M3322_05275, partial [Actinomycetota bacterium]|nr:hypothetical protein [Actinomycetota bacterium]